MDTTQNVAQIFENWGSSVFDFIPKLILAIIVIGGFYLLAKLLRKYSRRFYTRSFKKNSQAAPIIASTIYFLTLFSGIFIALEVLGLESVLTKLIAGAGVVGIIAGFAFKDIASNAFAGFLLNMQKPFKTGDWVSIDEQYGTIKKIGFITTSIKNVLGQEIFIPNQLIYNKTFTNFSTYKKRRVVLASGVSYGDDLQHVKQVALDEVRKMDIVIQQHEVDFYFTEIGSSTYNFEVRFWITFKHQTDFLNARSELIMRIKKRFEQENISIAYSIMTLDFGVKGGTNIFDDAVKVKPQH